MAPFSELPSFRKESTDVIQLSTSANIPKELPGDEPDDVLFNSLYGLRNIELNRPKKLNSLNGSMVRKIFPRLKVSHEECRLKSEHTKKY